MKLLSYKVINKKNKKIYIESYGCQMNFSDSEIITSIMKKNGFKIISEKYDKADIIFINICSIRDKAEQIIKKRLEKFKILKKKNKKLIIGILGCITKKLKQKLLKKKIINLIINPNSYRILPFLIQKINYKNKLFNISLLKKETYSNINPVKLNSNGINALISIMRGCDNICSFCIIPFTRGRERSRNPYSIIKESARLFKKGYKEITLLGQNVDSYKWEDLNQKINFSNLLSMLANINLNLRIRFLTSHPKDINKDVLYTIKKYENICNHIHLPIQSGNNRILKLMNRTYDREWYINKIIEIKYILSNNCSISSDIITGFCSETEKEHKDTLLLMDYIKYNFSYIFYYSERPGTLAEKKYKDDVPLLIKKKRLQEIINKQKILSLESNKKDLFKIYKVLIEGYSKKSRKYLKGKNSQNKIIVFPKKQYKKGEYINILIKDYNNSTLFGITF